MKKTNNKVEEFIRVDHAGERGAVKIYEGQLLALNTIIKDENLKTSIDVVAKKAQGTKCPVCWKIFEADCERHGHLNLNG